MYLRQTSLAYSNVDWILSQPWEIDIGTVIGRGIMVISIAEGIALGTEMMGLIDIGITVGAGTMVVNSYRNSDRNGNTEYK